MFHGFYSYDDTLNELTESVASQIDSKMLIL